VLRYRLDGVVTLVDAVYGHSTLDQHPEAVKQAAVADRLVLSKTDLLEGPQEAEAKRQLIERLRVLNPAAPILDAAAGQATASRLLDCGLYDPDHKIADVQRWLAEEAYADAPAHAHGDHAHDRNRHDDHIRAFALTAEEPIPAPAFDMFLDLVRSLHGPNLLRVKGIVNIADAPERPMVVHGIQHVFHPPASLPGWPDEDRRTRLVFITRDIEEQTIRSLFDAFLNTARPDQPDRAALLDNPLVPFGGMDG